MRRTRKEQLQEPPSLTIDTRPDTPPDLSEISGLPAVISPAQGSFRIGACDLTSRAVCLRKISEIPPRWYRQPQLVLYKYSNTLLDQPQSAGLGWPCPHHCRDRLADVSCSNWTFLLLLILEQCRYRLESLKR